MIFTNSSQHGGSFKKAIDDGFLTSKNITVAAGYFGYETIEKYHKRFIALAEHGTVRILLGMVFHTGVSKKLLKALEELNKGLMSLNPSSGVFITLNEYHGKLYVFDETMYVGSSNFSEAGVETRLECMATVSNLQDQMQVMLYLDYLFDAKVSPNLLKVDLNRKAKDLIPSTLISSFEVPSIPFESAIGSLDIPLRVEKQPCSSLNLYYDRGRIVRSTGLYTPRPWYEIEITTTKNDRDNPLYPRTVQRTPNKKSRIGSFNAFIPFRQKIYKIKMSVASDFGKAIASSEESGGRETLGFIIKGKLEDRKILKYGERITSLTLEEYGRDYITMTKLDDENYIMEF